MENWQSIEEKKASTLRIIPSAGKSVKITYQIISIAYEKLEKMITDKKTITPENVGIIIMYAFNIASDILMNRNKKYRTELVLIIIRKLIDKYITNPEDAIIFHSLIDTTVPSLVKNMSIKCMPCC